MAGACLLGGQQVDPKGHPVWWPCLSQATSWKASPVFQASRLSMVGTATSIIFVATKSCLLWREKIVIDKHVFVATRHVLSQQTQVFVTTKLLPWQNYVCHNNICCNISFVTPSFVKSFVTTKVLSQQKYVCHTKSFVATSILNPTKVLSWQTWYLWQLPPMILKALNSDASMWATQNCASWKTAAWLVG